MIRLIILAVVCMALFLFGRTTEIMPPAPPPGMIPVGEIPTVKYPSPVPPPVRNPLR